MQKSRDVFPVKTSHHLADITGYSLRTVEYWLSEKAVLPADALAALIQSEWGREYLAAVMTDATPRWWLLLKSWIKRIEYEAAEIAHQRNLRKLLEEEAARRPSTRPVFDPAFYEGQPSPHRALVPAPSKGRHR